MQKTSMKKEYDMAMKNKAITQLLLRVAIAGYIVYLAWKLLSNMLTGSGSFPQWAVWLVCVVFVAVAVWFCAYSLKGFKKALRAAEISAEAQPNSNDAEVNSIAPKDIEISDSEDL